MFMLYLDESGNTGLDLSCEEQPIFSLCGVIIDDKNFSDKRTKFVSEKIKICEQFENHEIHTTDIFNGKNNKNGNFRQNSIEDNLDILDKLIDLIISLNLRIIATKIDKKDYKQKSDKNLDGTYKCKCHGYTMQPYIRSLICISAWYSQFLNNMGKNGIVFVDELKSLEFWIKYNFFYIENLPMHNRIIESPVILNSTNNDFIQIADLINFYINKYHCIKNYNLIANQEKKLHCLKQYSKLKDKIIYIDIL